MSVLLGGRRQGNFFLQSRESESNRPSFVPGSLGLEDFLVPTLGGDLVPFRPLPAQRAVFQSIKRQQQEMREGKRIPGATSLVILKARRMGISTAIQVAAMKLLTTRPRTNALVIAHEEKSARYLYGMSEGMYAALKEEQKPPRRYQNRRGLTFDDPLGSSLSVDTIGEGAGRSTNVHLFHGSEVAFWADHAAPTLGAVRQCIPALPWCLSVLESTGYGLGGTFYHEFRRAKPRGEALFFPWWKDPRYRIRPGIKRIEWTLFEQREAEKYSLDEEQVCWMRVKFEKDCGADERVWRQEYPGCENDAFQGKAQAVIDPNLLEQLYAHIAQAETGTVYIQNGLKNEGEPEYTGRIRRLEEPGGPDSAYVIGADPAEGLETGDWSAATVLDRVSGRIVASLQAHLDTDQFAAALLAMGRFYNRAWLVVERNNHGHAVIQRLRDSGYPRIWSERRGWNVDNSIAPKFGFATTEGSKAAAIDSLIQRLRLGQLFCPFKEIVEELAQFQYDERGRACAPSGSHDDLAMALAITCRAAEDLGVRDPVALDRIRASKTTFEPPKPGQMSQEDFQHLVRLQAPHHRRPSGTLKRRTLIGDEMGVF